MLAAAEVDAHPGDVGHAQRPLGGAAQMGRAIVRAFQTGSIKGLLSACLNATI